MTDVILIPGGNFNCEFYFSVNNNTGNPFFYAELYKYDGTTFTLLGSSVGVPEYITQGTVINPYYFAIPVATATLALTDRLAIRIYVNVDGRTVTLHTENGHLCQVVTTLSKGMVSLNNLTDQSQFLTTGTSGTNFAIVSSGDTHTFNLPVASATNTGKLSSTDWTTFNNKQNALTNPVTGTGTSGQVAYFNGTNSITSNAAFAFTPTSQLLINNSVTAASAIARGTNLTPTLTAAANNDVLVGLDINPTFTNGAFTGVSNIPVRIGTSSTTPFGSPLIFMGRDQNAETNFQISNSTSGTSATVGFRIFGANGRSSQIFDYSAGHSNTEFASHLVIEPNAPVVKHGIIFSIPETTSGSDLMVYTAGRTSSNRKLTLFNSSGNLLLQSGGTFTDAGFRLDVNGTARVQGDTTITTALGIGTTYSNSFFPKLLIGGNSTGGINVFSVIASNTIQSDVTGTYQTFRSAPSTQATAFTLTNLTHYNLIDISKGAGSTITNQYGLFVNDLVSATNNFGIYSNISSGTNKYNLYINGTATNYFNSNIGINTTLPTFPLTRKGLVIRGTSDGAEINLQSTNATDGTFSGFALIASGNDGFILNRLSGNLSLGTNNNLNQLTIASNGTLTSVANATASGAIARGVNITPTLVAAANNDVLVGLDINPTFTNGAFTGVSNIGLRVQAGLSRFFINNPGSGVIEIQNSNATGFTSFAIFNNLNTLMGGFGWGNASAAALASTMYFDVTGNNPFIIRTNGSERIRFFGGGNVGINTGATDAGFRLDVNGTARVTGAATFSSSVTATSFEVGNGQYFKARRASGNLLLDLLGIESGTDNTRLLITGDFNVKDGSLSTLFTITSGGNVGIGTSSPNSLNSGANQLVVGNGSSTQGITIFTGSTSDGNIYFANGTSGSQVFNGAIGYNHNSNYMFFATNGGGERMRIYPEGQIGIKGAATTEAAYALFTNDANTGFFNIFAGGSGTATKGLKFKVTTGSSTLDAMTITSGGNVLIGTTTDNGQGKLQVNGAITATNISYTGELVTTSTTFNATYYHIISGAVGSGQTYTLPSPSSNNLQYVVINKSNFSQTISAGSGFTIYNMAGSDVGSITLASKARCFIIADGSGFYQIF
jgi:hypothetical protein